VRKRISYLVALAAVSAACGGGSSPTNPTPGGSTTPPQTTFTLTGAVTETAPSAFNKIPNATVEVVDGVNAGKSTVTDGAGNFRLPNLQQSTFSVRASASGYVSASRSVDLSADRSVTIQLNPAGPRTIFGAGQFLVGVEIAAGRYFADPTSGCYWERESGLGGTLGEILANDFVGFDAGQIIVDILSSDKAFKTQSQCGTWFNSPQKGAQSSITPGAWLVGSQITPGTYRAAASGSCYWERLRNFTGNLNAIIANDFVSGGGSVLVSISSGDTGFGATAECGTWTRISGLSESTTVEGRLQSAEEIERNRDRHRAEHRRR